MNTVRGILSGLSLCAGIYGAIALVVSVVMGAPWLVALLAAAVSGGGALMLSLIIEIGDEQRREA